MFNEFPPPGNLTTDELSHDGVSAPAPSMQPIQEHNQETEDSPPCPVDSLPPIPAAMVKAICEATGLPEVLAFGCVLSALSASIGKGLWIESNNAGRRTPSNLFMVLSADSGTGKSVAFAYAFSPLRAIEQSMRDEWEKETKPKLQAELKSLKLKLLNLEKQEAKKGGFDANQARELDKQVLMERRINELERLLKTQLAISDEDATPESTVTALGQNKETLSSLSSDAGSAINILMGGYSKRGDQINDSIYVKGFSVEAYKQSRVGRGQIDLPEPWLQLLWMVQPDKLDRLFGNRTLSEGGFLCRMLLAHTNCRPQEITGEEKPIPQAVANDYRILITDLFWKYRQSDCRHTLKAGLGGMEEMIAYHNKIVRERLGELADVTSFAARWSENAWRIAICLHAGKHGKDAHDHEVSRDTLLNAIRIMDYFAFHQLAILQQSRDAARRERLDKILAWILEQPDGVTARDVARKYFSGASDEAKRLLEVMCEQGDLEAEDKATGGRPTRIYRYKPQ